MSFFCTYNSAHVVVQKKLQYKVLIVGDTDVGKTALLRRFVEGRFVEQLVPTVGIDFVVEKVPVDLTQVSSATDVYLQIWDTAGQERFRTIATGYYRGAHAILFVYDCTNPASLAHLQRFVDKALEATGKDVMTAVVGNKVDQKSEKRVSLSDAEHALGYLPHVQFYETSALTGEAVPRLFQHTAQRLATHFPDKSMFLPPSPSSPAHTSDSSCFL